jgi:hypothetical protein
MLAAGLHGEAEAAIVGNGLVEIGDGDDNVINLKSHFTPS